MGKKYKIALISLLAIGAVFLAAIAGGGKNIAVLSPKGAIAADQYNLIVITSLLSLIVVVPVFALTFFIVWKYRVSNKKKSKYSPEWDRSHVAEAIWWGIPLLLITILSGIIWTSSHRLDPYRPIHSTKKPVTIQVIALNWKWLFIYPEQDIATVNYIQFPEKTPLNFQITSDAPMNSFWIPKLGGQVYAMAGMQTKLHLLANETGDYEGSSANISGEGFAGMRFTAKASSQADFERWATSVKTSSMPLDQTAYDELAKPSKNNQPAFYSSRDPQLYDRVVMKYMAPGNTVQPHDMHMTHSREGANYESQQH